MANPFNEEEIEAILLSNDIKTVSLYDLKIVFDGRFTEEYEDCEYECPVLLNYIGVSNHGGLYCNVVTYFSTHFPLVHGDKYTMSVIPYEHLQKISNYIHSKYKLNTRNKLKLELIKLKQSNFDIEILYPYTLKPKDFEHYVDCIHCCNYSKDSHFGSKVLEDTVGSPKDNEAWILNAINNFNHLFQLKVKYDGDFKNAGHLRFQTKLRYELAKSIDSQINNLIEEKMSDEFFNDLILSKFKYGIYHDLNNKQIKLDEYNRDHLLTNDYILLEASNDKEALEKELPLFEVNTWILEETRTNKVIEKIKELDGEVSRKYNNSGYKSATIIESNLSNGVSILDDMGQIENEFNHLYHLRWDSKLGQDVAVKFEVLELPCDYVILTYLDNSGKWINMELKVGTKFTLPDSSVLIYRAFQNN